MTHLLVLNDHDCRCARAHGTRGNLVSTRSVPKANVVREEMATRQRHCKSTMFSDCPKTPYSVPEMSNEISLARTAFNKLTW